MKNVSKKLSLQLLGMLFLTVMALIVIFPFYWMVISSLKTMEEYRANVPTLWPHKLFFQNFATAFSQANLKDLFLHTLLERLADVVKLMREIDLGRY